MASALIDANLTLALETQTRALLSELDKHLLGIDSKWESSVDTLESMVTDLTRHLDALPAHVCADLVAHQAIVDEVVDD
jgi:tetrahydromethanopterin S-methyltransferase subunit B